MGFLNSKTPKTKRIKYGNPMIYKIQLFKPLPISEPPAYEDSAANLHIEHWAKISGAKSRMKREASAIFLFI